MKKPLSFLGIFVGLSLAAQQAGTAPEFKGARALSEINKEKSAEAYPWLSPDGLRLYYTSSSSQEIMVAERQSTSDKFSKPVSASVPLKDPTSCWFSSDELHAYISTGHELYYAERASRTDAFGTTTPLELKGLDNVSFWSDASLDAGENHLFIMADIGSSFDYHIVEFSRKDATTFEYVRTLPDYKGYNISTGQISKDGLTFLAGIEKDDEEKLGLMTRKTMNEPFDVSTMKLLDGLGSKFEHGSQPCMSAGMEWIAFMQSVSDTWEQDELYIAHNTQVNVPEIMEEADVTDTAVAFVSQPVEEIQYTQDMPVQQDINLDQFEELAPVEEALPVEEIAPVIDAMTSVDAIPLVDPAPAIDAPLVSDIFYVEPAIDLAVDVVPVVDAVPAVAPVPEVPAVEAVPPVDAAAPVEEENASVMNAPQSSETDFSVMLYPNPTADNATIELPDASTEPVTIAVFSSTGQLLFQRTENYNGKGITIDTKALASGTYLVRCTLMKDGKPLAVQHPLIVQH